MYKHAKRKIRKKICDKRAQLPQRYQHEVSDTIVNVIAQLPIYIQSKKQGFYFPYNGEIDTEKLWQQSHKMGKSCYFPVLNHSADNTLHFVPYHPGDPLTKNKYGIPEPIANIKDTVDVQQLDLVIVPVVAFNDAGYRLGMGAGYYDRTFNFLKEKGSAQMNLIGVAYEFQKHDEIPIDEWDVPLSAVVTEKKVYWR